MSDEKKEEKKSEKKTDDNNEQQDERVFLFEKLEKPKHQLAIEMKLDGFRHKDIAAACRLSVSRVDHLFAKGHKVQEAYDEMLEYLTQERMEGFKKVADQLQSLAIDAVQTYRHALRTKKSWKAAESVLDRTGFQPVQKIEDLSDPKEAIIIINRPEQKKDDTTDEKPDGGESDSGVQSDTEAG